jgi:hypothetical protein
MSKLEIASGHRWRTFALFAVIAILCALSFLKYLGWAAFYSGNPSAGEAAGRKAELFFWAFIILEALAALVIARRIRLESTFSPHVVRLAARYCVGLILSVLATGVVIGVLVTFGSRLRP